MRFDRTPQSVNISPTTNKSSNWIKQTDIDTFAGDDNEISSL